MSIILPCAGSGSRLGLSAPKELFEVWESVPLIRFSLEHILRCKQTTGIQPKVVLVIREGKESVADYVSKFLGSEISVEVLYANSDYDEWPGSIYSASNAYEDRNLVLLPDSCLELGEDDWLSNDKGQGLLELANLSLESKSLTFGAVDCSDFDRLQSLGALEIGFSGEVLDFQDKPTESRFYNSFWGCMAFKRDLGEELYGFLSKSVQKKKTEYQSRSFYPASSFDCSSYVDLGCWDAIRSFQQRFPYLR